MSQINVINKEGKDLWKIRAAEHFDVAYEDVTTKQREFVKAQAYAENYGFRGVPKREYSVSESGVVEFGGAV